MSDQDEQLEQVDEQPTTTSGRRDLSGKAGVAAAVAAVAGLAVSKSAEAADGGNMLIGRNNGGNSANSTALTGGTSLWVQDGVTGGGNNASIRGSASADDHAGVRGEATGSAGKGVYGLSTGTQGSGVYGLNTFSGSNGESGVYGRNTGNGHGVKGSTTDASGAGVYGTHTKAGARGVYGRHDNSSSAGTGVLGVAVIGVGVEGRGTQYDLRTGASGRLGLDTAGHDGSPSDGGAVGTVARDAAGNLWYCYASNKWQRLGGPNSAGSLHPIIPARVYDSRRPAPEPGRISTGESRVVSVADKRDNADGSVIAADIVPAGATAVAYNVTVEATAVEGFLSINPGDAASFSAASINWSLSNLTLGNAGIVKLDTSRQIKVFAGGPPGSSTNFIIDITAYYV
jgi:hypothetical protein